MTSASGSTDLKGLGVDSNLGVDSYNALAPILEMIPQSE